MAKEKVPVISSEEILAEISKTMSMLLNNKLSSLSDTLNEEFKRYCSRIENVSKEFKDIDEAVVKTKKISKDLERLRVDMSKVHVEVTQQMDMINITLHDIKKEYIPIKANIENISEWESKLEARMEIVLARRTHEVEQYFTNRFAGFLKDTDEVAKKKLAAVNHELNQYSKE